MRHKGKADCDDEADQLKDDTGAPLGGRPGWLDAVRLPCNARSRQNGLGSIPVSCVTRSDDRLTDGGPGEDLGPGRGAPVCRSLKAGALTGPE